mmetsp:Transcript_40683/g.90447  ORF Transcript_40683/g.90447 Transcript_40683/m.90447 type:complete len:302 (-) Transcript_40683:194-1099(-)
MWRLPHRGEAVRPDLVEQVGWYASALVCHADGEAADTGTDAHVDGRELAAGVRSTLAVQYCVELHHRPRCVLEQFIQHVVEVGRDVGQRGARVPGDAELRGDAVRLYAHLLGLLCCKLDCISHIQVGADDPHVAGPPDIEVQVLLRNHAPADAAAQHAVEECVQLQARPHQLLALALPQTSGQHVKHGGVLVQLVPEHVGEPDVVLQCEHRRQRAERLKGALVAVIHSLDMRVGYYNIRQQLQVKQAPRQPLGQLALHISCALEYLVWVVPCTAPKVHHLAQRQNLNGLLRILFNCGVIEA